MVTQQDSVGPVGNTNKSYLTSPVAPKTPEQPEASSMTTVFIKEVSSPDTTALSNTSIKATGTSRKSEAIKATAENGAGVGNQSTESDPIKKAAQGKGGFVHTLTANDGSKAQVFLSRNGAHAGIVFRNEILRGKVICCDLSIVIISNPWSWNKQSNIMQARPKKDSRISALISVSMDSYQPCFQGCFLLKDE